MSQLIAELADGRPLKEIAEDFDIDYDKIRLAWIDLVEQTYIRKRRFYECFDST
jgi:uncharacterized protein (DUF433 family)